MATETSSRARAEDGVQAFRFGVFEMDLRSGELRRSGTVVRLQPQPFKVLAMLVDKPGEVISRDEIQSRVWPVGTFVDFEQSLNFCIRQIRAALGDSAVRPRFVETLPRRGYRWVGGSVEKISPPATVHEWPRPVTPGSGEEEGLPGAGAPDSASPSASELRWWTVAMALAGAVVVLGALALAYHLGGQPVGGGRSPVFERVTFRRGAVTSGRFGPENEIVYVASWEGRPFRMELVNAGARQSRPLDVSNARIVAASDSEVAFVRRGVLARAPLAGGPPREVSQGVVAADWTSDTEVFAVVRHDEGRFRLEYPIGTVLGETAAVSRLRLSPDGTLVALAEHTTIGDDRGRVAIVDQSGERVVVSEGWSSLDGVAWSPRGDEVWFTATRVGAECELHGLALDGTVRTIHAAMGRLVLHDVAPDGRVLLERTGLRSETYFHHDGEEDRELTWLDVTGAEGLSADGSQVLLVESGEGGGLDYLSYLRPTDGSLPVSLGPGRATSLSPDGKWALMIPIRNPDHVQIVPTGPGRPRRVEIPGASSHDAAGWLPDGKSLYVTTRDASGARVTWLADAAGGAPKALPLPEGVALYHNTFSPDGTRFVARCADSKKHCVYETAGGRAEPLEQAEAEWVPVAWDQEDRVFFRDRSKMIPEVLWRVDVASGEPQRVAEITPRDRSGILGLTRLTVAQSGEAWAYSFMRRLSDLYVVSGLE
jgi:DNA-binding winged helix-turn-helix (wHTH) protein/sugar lactone lactonase YvrE